MPASVDKIPHIQRIKKPDGRIHLYFRKGTYREGPLSGADGSEELRAQVAAILARINTQQKSRIGVEGTVGGMVVRYAGDGDRRKPCAEFLSLASSTQAEYFRMAKEIRQDCGDVLLSDVTPNWLRDVRDAWALQGYKAANDRRQVLKNALMPALDDERIAVDPFRKIKKLARPHDAGEAHPIWEDHEFAAAIDDALARSQVGVGARICSRTMGRFPERDDLRHSAGSASDGLRLEWTASTAPLLDY